MNRYIARIIMGYFKTGNQARIYEAAKMLSMKPANMLNKAYLLMGRKKPITVYKTKSGKTMPIGVREPKKPKADPYGGQDPQTGYLDDYHRKKYEIKLILDNIKEKVFK